MILSNLRENSEIESLFGGACTSEIEGKSILKPRQRPSGILAKCSSAPAFHNSHSHASALYRVRGNNFLCSRTLLGAMCGCTTSQTDVVGIVFGGGAPFITLPSCANLFPILRPESLADTLCKGFELFVPCLRG
jgi:hypothetical protein